jgi:hypothetical protein
MADSGSSATGLINLDMKETGKPSAGDLHAGFDAAGAGNQLTVWLMRHSQRKRRATDRPNLRCVAPVLEPTCEGLGVRFPGLLGAIRDGRPYRDTYMRRRATGLSGIREIGSRLYR